MSTRGPKPAPTALKVLAGTRADRVNPDEPAAVQGRPECPGHLDERGREEWDRMVELLDRMGVLSQTDGAALALYCSTFSQWLSAKEEIAKDGLTVATDKGGLKTHPCVTIAHAAAAQMARMLVEFGCTPSARSRVKAVKGDGPKDKLGEFLARKKRQ